MVPGFDLPASEVLALLQEVDHDHSGAVEYGEFLEIMVEVFQRRAEAQQDEGKPQKAEVGEAPSHDVTGPVLTDCNGRGVWCMVAHLVTALVRSRDS